LASGDIPASLANDFADIEKWLPVSKLLITYVAGPYPDRAQSRAIRPLARGGRKLARLARKPAAGAPSASRACAIAAPFKSEQPRPPRQAIF